MNIRRNNESGFGIIEALIILVVIGIIGFAGWSVWHGRQTVGQPHPQPKAKDGWLMYRSMHSAASFQYPATWKMTENPTPSADVLKLEDVTLVGPNNFNITYNLYKTYHGRVIYNASCIAPPKVTVLSTIGDNLSISYDSYQDMANSLWLATTGKLPAGYGYATGQCRVRGVDYIAMPNDVYITLTGAYAVGKDSRFAHLSATDYLNQPEVKTAIDIFKSFSP